MRGKYIRIHSTTALSGPEPEDPSNEVQGVLLYGILSHPTHVLKPPHTKHRSNFSVPVLNNEFNDPNKNSLICSLSLSQSHLNNFFHKDRFPDYHGSHHSDRHIRIRLKHFARYRNCFCVFVQNNNNIYVNILLA